MIAIPETMFKVLSKLGDTEPSLREGALGCLLKRAGHGTGSNSQLFMGCVKWITASVKDILRTKQCILYVLEMLHGRDEDEVVLRLVDGMVGQLEGMQHAKISVVF
jgi:hypothetical protein